ncbi:MAG: hypothetical protein EBQ92_02175 [Proteobacteria bacterium]|nr:hypothetical protein [Pseudomonadota bacterium]
MKLEKKKLQFQKALSVTLIYSLIAPSFIRAQEDSDAPNASTKSAIMQLGSMQTANTALQNLNKAMESAAQNPNDDWRRDEVRKAVQAVPSAVQGVASTFAVNSMANSALPFVLSTLGAAIDVDAPNSFDKHLKTPEAIQKSSEGATESKRPEELTYVVKEEALRFEIPVVKAEPKSTLPVSDIAQVTFTSVSQEIQPEPKTVFSEIVREKEFKETEILSSVVPSLHEDIAIAEAALKQAEEVKTRELSSVEEPEFLFEKTPKKDSKAQGEKRPRQLKPTSWLLAPLFYLASFENEAHAEQGQTGNNDPTGGSPTNPGNGAGGGAGGVLFGIAAIIGAVAPMIVASTQAQSQENVAQTQSQAQIQQAEIQSATQKEMAQLSSQTALAQAEAQRQVAQMNNDSQTQRLQINLAAQQQQRNEQRQQEAEQLALQKQLSAQQTALAMQKADQQIAMVRQSNEAQKLQLAAAGSSAGVATQQAGATARTASGTSAGSPIAASLAMQALEEATKESNTAQGARGLTEQTSRTASRALMAPTNRLLASVDEGVLNQAENIPAVRNALGRTRGLVRGIRKGLIRRAPLSSARGLYRSGLSLTAAGSFAEGRANSQRDLTQFAQEVNDSQSETEVFESRRSVRQNPGRSTH